MGKQVNGDVTILVADDDEDIREMLRYRLEKAGYAVIAAVDGKEALALAIAHKPDLAVLDVMMPNLNGYEVTEEIRANEEIRGTPVIFLTASVQDAAVAKGFEAGANDYIRKPFSPQEFLARVSAALSRG
jgi:DNA-binding response OmpR family regulator